MTRASEDTVRDYLRWYNMHLKCLIGDCKLEKITPRMITDVHRALIDKGLSDDYIHRLHGVLNRVLDSAQRRGIIKDNPVSRVLPPRKRTGKREDERDALSRAEVDRFIEAVSGEPLYWRTLYGLLLATGLRREELVGLRWEHIEKDYIRIELAVRSRPNKELLVKGPKNENSRRKLAMTKFMRALLIQWNKACGGPTVGYLFPSPNDSLRPLYPDTVTSHTASVSKRIGVCMSPRSIRHLFMTVNGVHLGANINVISRLAGHGDKSIDAVYMDSVLSAKRDLQERYEDYLCLPQ